MRRVAVGWALLAASVSLAGCVRVKPYEREYLSERVLTPGVDRAEDRFRQHVDFAREGTVGGYGAAGGGCGCN